MAEKSLETVLEQLRHAVGAPSAEELGDEQLLQRFTRDQEEAAFATLVRRHGPMVFGVCRRVLRDAHQAEDAFQATFLVLARKAGTIRKQESLASWLYGVAYRISGKARASSLRRSALERRAMGMRQDKEHDSLQRPELEEALDQELHKLPEKYRAPLVLCYLQGKTNEEAAQQLGWTTGTVRGRLFRGRDLLRGRLVRRGLGVTSGVALTAFMAEAAHATPPTELLEATVRAGMLFAKGKAASAGVVSVQAAAMADGAMRGMYMDQFKVPALVAAAGGLASLVAFVAYGAMTDRQPLPPGPVVDPVVHPAAGAEVGAGIQELGVVRELGITKPGFLGALVRDQRPLAAELTLVNAAGLPVADREVTFRWQGGQEVQRTNSLGAALINLEPGSIENLRVLFPRELTPRFRLLGRDGQEFIPIKADPSEGARIPDGFVLCERPGLQVLVPPGKQQAGEQALKDLQEMRLLLRALTGLELTTPCRLVLFAQGQAAPSGEGLLQFATPLADYEAALNMTLNRPAELAQWQLLHRWAQSSLTPDLTTVQEPAAQFAKSGLAEVLAFEFCRKHYPQVAACRLRAFQAQVDGLQRRGDKAVDLRQNFNQGGGAPAFVFWRGIVAGMDADGLRKLANRVRLDPAGSFEAKKLNINLLECKQELEELIKECEGQGG